MLSSPLLTDPQTKRRALREVGDTGSCALWEVALPQNTMGGTWTLGFGGQTSAPIAALADRDAVKAALESLSSVGAGNAEVVGIVRGPFRVRFVGVLGAQPLPAPGYPLDADGSVLNPSATLAPFQLEAGDSPVLEGVADELLLDIGYQTRPDLRYLTLKLALIDTLLGQSHKGVDVQTAGRMEKLQQQHASLLQLRNLTWDEINRTLSFNTTADQSTTPLSGKIHKATPNGLPYGQMPRYGLRLRGRRF